MTRFVGRSRASSICAVLACVMIAGCSLDNRPPGVDVEPAARGEAKRCVKSWNEKAAGPLDPHDPKENQVVVAVDGATCRIIVRYYVGNKQPRLMELRVEDGRFRLSSGGGIDRQDVDDFASIAVLDPRGRMRLAG